MARQCNLPFGKVAIYWWQQIKASLYVFMLVCLMLQWCMNIIWNCHKNVLEIVLFIWIQHTYIPCYLQTSWIQGRNRITEMHWLFIYRKLKFHAFSNRAGAYNQYVTIVPILGVVSFSLYFVSPRERPLRQRVFRVKTLVIARATCVLSHAFKKEHRDWRIKDASCSVYPWACSVTSRSFSGWDKVYMWISAQIIPFNPVQIMGLHHLSSRGGPLCNMSNMWRSDLLWDLKILQFKLKLCVTALPNISSCLPASSIYCIVLPWWNLYFHVALLGVLQSAWRSKSNLDWILQNIGFIEFQVDVSVTMFAHRGLRYDEREICGCHGKIPLYIWIVVQH